MSIQYPVTFPLPPNRTREAKAIRLLVDRLVETGCDPAEAAAEVRRFESVCEHIADLIYQVAAESWSCSDPNRVADDWQAKVTTLRDLTTRVTDELIGHALRTRLKTSGA